MTVFRYPYEVYSRKLQTIGIRLAYRRFCSDKKQTTNYYDVLGISSEATPQEIKTSYYNLCKQLHPDTATKENIIHQDDVLKFIAVGEAYEILGNKEKRAEYDRQLVNNRLGQVDIGRDLQNYQDFRSRWRNRAMKMDEQMRREEAIKFRREYKFDQKDFDRFYTLYKRRQTEDQNLHWEAQAYTQAQRFASSDEMHAKRRHDYDQFHRDDLSSNATMLYAALGVCVFCMTLAVFTLVESSNR